jgi:GTPase SAR1 family protein
VRIWFCTRIGYGCGGFGDGVGFAAAQVLAPVINYLPDSLHVKSIMKEFDGLIFTYSLALWNSLEKVKESIKFWQDHCGDEYYPGILVGTKADLKEQREVDSESVEEFIKVNLSGVINGVKLRYPHFEVSAKEGWNCDEALQQLILHIQKYKLLKDPNSELHQPKHSNKTKSRKCSLQ